MGMNIILRGTHELLGSLVDEMDCSKENEFILQRSLKKPILSKET
jgi:hypothetical protein